MKLNKQVKSKSYSSEAINKAILLGSGSVIILVNCLMTGKVITGIIDLIALLTATYAFVQLSKDKNFRRILVDCLTSLLIFIGIMIVGMIIFFMIMLA